jgi:hypothetical protein
MTFKSLRSISPTLKAASASKKAANEVAQSSFFDPEPVKTVEDGKAYLRKLQQAQKQREVTESCTFTLLLWTLARHRFSLFFLNVQEEESLQSSTFGVGASFQNDGFNGIYGNASMVPRVYQASGFDPYIQESTKEQEEDALQTSSNPLVAWRQLEEWGIAMFMHLYCRNIRRLLAYHVKDFVEAFIQNASELNECGVMADVLLRRMPSQALLCPPGQTNQMTNVSLSDMLHGLTKSPLFVSKTRGVNLFEEHTSVRLFVFLCRQVLCYATC